MSSSPPIVITGFMGSGKTTVARTLSRALNCELVDLDRFITEQTGRSPKEIIEQDGEPAFRTVETDCLRTVLAGELAHVIALGGGAWTIAANRDLIHEYNALTVWLDVPFSLCWQRISASGGKRPLARERDQAHSLYLSRRPLYELAGLHIEANEGLSDQEAAARIASALTQR